MKPILMRMGCVGMLLLAAGIVDGAGSRPYSSQAFWPLLLLAMGIAVGGMGLGVRAELLNPTPEYECENTESETKRPRPCGNTDEAKEVEIAISTKNIPFSEYINCWALKPFGRTNRKSQCSMNWDSQ